MQLYGLIFSLALWCSVEVANKLAKQRHINCNFIYGIALWGILGGILGARIYHVADFYMYYKSDPIKVFFIWQGGLAIWGGLFGGLLSGFLYAKKHNLPFEKILDIGAVSIPLAQSIGRLGNFFNNEIYGTQTNLLWAITMNNTKVHPLFAYEAILNFIIFLVMLKLFTWRKFEGKLVYIYLIAYSTVRFMLDFIRSDPWKIYSLNVSQVVSILTISICFYLLKNVRKN